MKHLTNSILLSVLLTLGAHAQEAGTGTETGAKAISGTGKYSLDINFNPAAIFDASAGDMFTMPTVKGRYYFAPGMAIRGGIGLGLSSSKTYTDSTGGYSTTTSSTSLTLSPGIEKQLPKGKLVLYYGAELPIRIQSGKSESEYDGGSSTTKNPNGNGCFGVGLNAVLGFDFYVFENVYVGAELTPGLAFTKYFDTKTEPH